MALKAAFRGPERLLLGYNLQGHLLVRGEPADLVALAGSAHGDDHARPDRAAQLRKVIKRKPYRLAMDTAFGEVLRGCAEVPRPGQTGTWLIPDMVDAYEKLHELGFAHSVEAWLGDELVGGLYGVSLGGVFFGESMFARAPDASKIAFVASVRQLDAWRIGLIDCQVHTEHLERFGAYEVPRLEYLEMLALTLDEPTRRGTWTFEIDLDELAATGGMMEPSAAEPEAPSRKKRASHG